MIVPWSKEEFYKHCEMLDEFSNENTQEKFVPLASSFLFQLRGTNVCSWGFQTIPGSFFSYSHPNLCVYDLEILFFMLMKKQFLIMMLDQNVVMIITQIASFNFKYFVEKMVPYILSFDDQAYLQFFITVATIILDPTTGFLRNAPLSRENCEWEENTSNFDFFSENSTDLRTVFGQSLTTFRQIIAQIAKKFIIYPFPTIKRTKLPTIFVPSFMFTVQTIIVPPMFRTYHLSCGFPGRVEILLAISSLQRHQVFKILKGYTTATYKNVTDAWGQYYQQLTGFDALEILKPMEFAPSDDCSKHLLIRLLKISLFIGFPILDNSQIGDFIISGLLGDDPQLMPFMIVWSQAMIIVYNHLAPVIFSSICNAFDYLHILSSQQQYALYHEMARFLDVYVCLPGRFIDNKSIIRVLSHGLIGLSSVHVPVRHVALKVIISIGRFNNQNQIVMLHEFINDNKKQIITAFLKYFGNQPAYLLKNQPPRPYQILTFDLLLASTNQTLWQLMLASITQVAVSSYNHSIIRSIRSWIWHFLSKFPCQQIIGSSFSSDFMIINALTLLGSTIFLDDDDMSPNSETMQILDSLLSNTKRGLHTFGSQVRMMYVGLNKRAFPFVLSKIMDESDPSLIGLVLSSIAWNDGFPYAISQDVFFMSFIQLTSKLINILVEKQILPSILNQNFDTYTESFIHNHDLLCDFCAISYQIFKQIEIKYIAKPQLPFPCHSFVINTDHPEIHATNMFFVPIYSLAITNSSDPSLNRLKSYSTSALTMWFSINCHSSLSLVSSSDFLHSIHTISYGAPKMLSGLLSHHFECLFPRFLQLSLQNDGDHFFKAICFFFMPTINETITDPEQFLISIIWRSCSPIKNSPSMKYLQVIYENWGTFILTCLFYLIRPQKALTDSAFMVLASLTPVIYIMRMKGRKDNLGGIFQFFVEICRRYPSTLSLIDNQSIYKISETLSQLFPFCLEQVLFDLMEFSPSLPRDMSSSIFPIFSPWFKLVEFDIENRVISRETELLFMKFSCYSFVEKMFATTSHVSSDNPNATNNDIWRAICIKDDSPSPNIPVILYSITSFTDSVIHVLRYIYTISSIHVLEYLVSFLSFNFHFFNSHKSDTRVLFFESHESESDDTIGSSRTSFAITPNDDMPYKVLTVLHQLCLDSISPMIPYLPRILSFCIIFKDQCSDRAESLIMAIFKELPPHLKGKSTKICTDIIHRFSMLPNYDDIIQSIQYNTNLFQLPEGSTSWRDVSILFAKFFRTQDPKLLRDYSLCCLRWGLCCGDLMRASIAMKCFRGAIDILDLSLVGLSARAISNVSRVLYFMLNEKREIGFDPFPCVNYMRSVLKTLRFVAEIMFEKGLLASDSAIFWIAMESLKCNSEDLSPIFNAGMHILEFLFKHPELFENIMNANCKKFVSQQYTHNTFWKYHRPWSDRFRGCYKYVLGFTGRQMDPEQIIRFINLMVQLKCPPLFSDSPKWQYTALLSLLPWMWSVVITDIARFLQDTPKIQMMQKTIDALCLYCDSNICNMLNTLFKSNEKDMYSMIFEIICCVLQLMDQEDLPLICNFYANCLTNGDRFIVVPLYSIASIILKSATNPQAISTSLNRFSKIVEGDTKESRRFYAEIYREAIKSAPKPELSVCNENPFPKLEFYDRIVAILVPHLFEFNPIPDEGTTFSDIGSFPPLLPSINGVMDDKHFRELRNVFMLMRVEPYSSIFEFRTKMHTSLIDLEALDQMKKLENFGFIDLNQLFIKVLDGNDERTDVDSFVSEDIKELEKDVDPSYTDPYSIFTLNPFEFVPDLYHVNSIGDEIFQDNL